MSLFPTRAAYRKAPLQDFCAAVAGASTVAASLILATPGEVRETSKTTVENRPRGQHVGNIIASCRCDLLPFRPSTPFADQLLGCRDNLLVRGPVPGRC